ncbi:hypothetical protein NW768_011121 [Fusarium equiseti]|uniref:Uncharacterized protein n=1 Tax=Fusarium equiseti TaxID=61235 RepID=A0ABQ8QYQ8_FUSEQ|nr:hypothetical protein NW768_011121 [Fusarium equiseti]
MRALNQKRVIPPGPELPFTPFPDPPSGPNVSAPGIFQKMAKNFRSWFQDVKADEPSREQLEPNKNFLVAEVDVMQAEAAVLSHHNFKPAYAQSNSEDDSWGPMDPLRPLDNLESLSISEKTSEALWKLEVKRLVSGVNDCENAISFPDMDVPDGDYALLASLVKDIVFAVEICELENEGLLRERNHRFHDPAEFNKGREYLRRKLAPPDNKMGIRPKAKKKNHGLTKQTSQKFIFALIDYITVVLAKVFVYSASHDPIPGWRLACIACLAKFTTKVKIITTDPEKFATQCLDAADDRAKEVYVVKDEEANVKDQATTLPPTDELARLRKGTEDQFFDQREWLYYAQEAVTLLEIRKCFDFILNALQGQSYNAAPRTTYEICSVVYETGLEGFKTWVYQERDGDIEATACQKSLAMARPAFQLVQKTAEALKTKQGRHPPQEMGAGNRLKTKFEWKDVRSDELNGSPQDNEPKRTLDVRTIEEVITVLVPLSATSPSVATKLPRLFQMITLTGTQMSNPQKPLSMEDGRFQAFFCLSTTDYQEIRNEQNAKDASSLSKGLMTRKRLLGGTNPAGFDHGRTFESVDQSVEHNHQDSLFETLTNYTKKMNSWTFEESSVMVSCKIYVWTTMILAIALAIGGVAVGFTVKDKIKGVDPFNVTTYCWVLAAFYILVAKSLRVEVWSWRDFLRGRVRCRSVTELHSVTRIPEELIICKLLDTEDTTILNTRGPHNAVFRRKAENGFSIDTRLSLWTMLLSGLIMVKVNTTQGPALSQDWMYLYGRKGPPNRLAIKYLPIPSMYDVATSHCDDTGYGEAVGTDDHEEGFVMDTPRLRSPYQNDRMARTSITPQHIDHVVSPHSQTRLRVQRCRDRKHTTRLQQTFREATDAQGLPLIHEFSGLTLRDDPTLPSVLSNGVSNHELGPLSPTAGSELDPDLEIAVTSS